MSDSLLADQEAGNNDRELIENFLLLARDAQKRIVKMEENNNEMKTIADNQINEKK
jgi:hypothetical protein